MKGLIEEVRGEKRDEKEEGGGKKEKKKDRHGMGCGQERPAGPQRPLHDQWCLFV